MEFLSHHFLAQLSQRKAEKKEMTCVDETWAELREEGEGGFYGACGTRAHSSWEWEGG